MVVNCLRFFGLTDMYEIETMTISEYYTRLEAYQLKQVDIQKNLALQSWYNQTVQATTGSAKNPKPKYSKFEKFFDAMTKENEIKEMFDPNYKPVVLSESGKKEKQAELFAKRQREWEELHIKKGG